MHRQQLALLLVALVACTQPRPSARGPTAATRPPAARAQPPEPAIKGQRRPPSAVEQALVDDLMREVEGLRKLRFVAPVAVSIEDRHAMRAYVERAIDDEPLERARLRYLALGVLDPQLDLRTLLVALMEEELIGYYDPKEKRLAVRSDIARALKQDEVPSGRSLVWRATVVHELVHALQDQHFGLAARIAEERSTDADNAFGALVEGDATLVALGYAAKLAGESLRSLTASPERVEQMVTRSPAELTGALRRAPALVREPLLFRYREGAAFCAELFRAGGFRAIDAAHRELPQSTHAIRFPAGYVAGARPPSLPLPELAWLTTLGVRLIDHDVLGSLELGVILGASAIDTATIVAGWRGDRYAVLRHGQRVGSLWWLRFADAKTAERAAAAFARLGDPQRRIARRGRLLLVAHGVAQDVYEAAARSHRGAPFQAHASEGAPAARGPAKHGHPLATAARQH